MSDWNEKIIAEFRANEGRVGGNFEGAPLLLLHSTGARTGKERVNPMMYQAVGDSFAVFASKAGADTNPDWFHNLKANPDVTFGGVPMRATVITDGAERRRLWDLADRVFAPYATYRREAAKADREIPIVQLSESESGSPGVAG